ncbi:uroporphyrinogen decarboxylase family protein [Youngiibacter fragilis]|uniref:Uroporphyrinogen decarboxylase n=1 Tax=Youngiibacter fragilis 232.1 TaxID=994573 RepID=V7I8Q3_9CLOT|nr:uroporphyrinogen decarboxylase family protein [Youngiibacter fragilis]ETA81619.1 uroporphyrinogen decarboxylase [Youngiibacter fragilis 232.1]
MSKRQLVSDAFNNRPVERVPVGFWFHFVDGDDFSKGLEYPSVIQKNIEGHIRFYNGFKPDFVKLMSDGFFNYPNPLLADVKDAAVLKSIKPVGGSHPWIRKQVELVKTLTETFGGEVLTFYNIFAPATYFKFLQTSNGNELLGKLIREDSEAVRHALDVIGEDLASLADLLIKEGGADGIYLSVQNIQDPYVNKEKYLDVVAPGELKVLDAANRVSDNNILHICGYEGSRNDLSFYSGYDAKAVNWAVNIEDVSLSEGKRFFNGKAVIGGFANSPGSLIHTGSKNEIESFTKALIADAGTTGIIIGADCTVPNDIRIERLEWVRSAAQIPHEI